MKYLKNGLDLVGDPPLETIKSMVIYMYVSKNKLNNNHFYQNAISHKELNDFLIKAKKDIFSNDHSDHEEIKEEQHFNHLIQNWTEISQEILLIMNKKEKVFAKNKNPKSLIAFGAMGAHINMALQALKATGSNQ